MCSKYNDWSQRCCQCIAEHESGGNAHAQNHNTNGSNDIGVWQINDVNWNSCNGGRAPCDANENLRCAHQIWAGRSGTWAAWSTCSICGCCGTH